MKLAIVSTMVLAAGAQLATGCVSYTTQQVAPMPTVTAHVQVRAPSLAVVPDVPAVVGTRVDGSMIHAALDRYGTWGQDPTYGNVWYPDTAPQGFVPYGTDGRWQLTDAGWYWQSQLPWGWLTFHYGRWVQVEQRWGWVPGALFAPAWVDWRVADGMVGWAPLPPEGAMYSAPYAFCPCGQFLTESFWSSCSYGAAASGYYAGSVGLPVAYGFGGALYAWGPPATTFSGPSIAAPIAVPVATAWHGSTGAAHPVYATPTGGTTAGSQPRSGGPAGMTATGSTTPPSTGLGPVTRPAQFASNASPVGPHPVAPGVSPPPVPQHTRWVATVPSSPVYDDHATFARYRAPDAVVVSDEVARGPITRTVSLGSTGGVAEGSGPMSGSYGAIPSSAGYASAQPVAHSPAQVPWPSSAPSYTGASSYSTAPGYAPSPVHMGSYSAPSYIAPSAAYSGSSGGGWSAPSYTGAAHYSTAPAPAPTYSAPSFHAPSYAPSSGGGYHFGGGGGVHFGGFGRR